MLTTGNWDGAKASAAVTAAKLEVKFFGIDIDEGTAEADGGFGETLIIVKYSHGYLHLMQMSDAGPLYVTTVLATQTPNGRFKAMHTRHEWSPALVPGSRRGPRCTSGIARPRAERVGHFATSRYTASYGRTCLRHEKSAAIAFAMS